MMKSADPTLRLQSLSSLCEGGKADHKIVLSALETALADEDATVMGYAVQSLAKLGIPNIMDYLWQAFRDPDPSIRVMVIESVPQSEGLSLLQTALSDPDETIRSIAALRLKPDATEQE
jgi:hypothetical protein